MACLYFFGLARSVCRYDYGNSELDFAISWLGGLAIWRDRSGSWSSLAWFMMTGPPDWGGPTRIALCKSQRYAWNTLIDQPWKIMSIARRDWAAAGHLIW